MTIDVGMSPSLQPNSKYAQTQRLDGKPVFETTDVKKNEGATRQPTEYLTTVATRWAKTNTPSTLVLAHSGGRGFSLHSLYVQSLYLQSPRKSTDNCPTVV